MQTLPSNIVNSFFAPASTDLLKPLIASYDSEVENLKRAINTIESVDFSKAFDTFVEAANKDRASAIYTKMFNLDDATGLINSNYWQRAMNMTDVYDHMPQKRRDEWHDMIRERKCPAFEVAAVYATFEDLLRMRSQFIAERVDGIFRSLSGEHVTNSPTGFRKRMIMANVIENGWFPNHTKGGHIDDLRKVIAKLLGRDEPRHGTSSTKLRTQYNYTGEWFDWDGGTIRVRVYLKGTAHIEIHPDIAWQLNQILAFLYPAALSHASIRKPEKAHKDFKVINNPIADSVLHELSEGRINGMIFEPSTNHKQKVIDILQSIGGVKTRIEKRTYDGRKTFETDVIKFDYSPNEVIANIILTGELPDKVTHQFYPTPDELAAHVVTMAEINSDHTVLEPSAGQGSMADHIDGKHRIQCVELSELHCEILKSKGYNVDKADFLKFDRPIYDRIIMNPPFSEGRAKLHLEHAVTQLAPGGRLVAILPSGMRDKPVNGAKSVQYSEVLHNQFPDARVSVVICTIDI